jgi:PST family polysaccharide transporter
MWWPATNSTSTILLRSEARLKRRYIGDSLIVCFADIDRGVQFRHRRSRLLFLLRQLLQRPYARAAAHNLGWLVTERLVRLLFTVLVGFAVARYLGPADFGRLSYALALVALATVLTQMGVDQIVKREIIQAPAEAPALLSAVWRLRLAAGAACYFGVLGWAWMAEPDDATRVLLAIVSLLVFQPALAFPDLWLQANLRARTAVIAQTVALAAGAGTRLVLIVLLAPLWAFGVVGVVEAFFVAMLLTAMARRVGMRVSAAGQTAALIRRLVAESWPLLLSSLAITIYMRIDLVMLQRLAGADVAGTYAAAVKISEVWYFLPMALASSVLPALIRARNAGPDAYAMRWQQYFDGSAALAYGLSTPIALAAPWLVQVAYGAQFAAAGRVLAVHIWAAPFVFVGVARGQYLVNEKLTRFALIASMLGALVNIGLNLVLIPVAGAVGAACATVVSYAIATWTSSFFHPAVRPVAKMQTRALLLPLTGWRYFRRT